MKAAEGIIDGLLATSGSGPGRDSGKDESAPRLIAKVTFDPFNPVEMRELNNMLYEYGYCLYIKKYADPFVPAWSENQCQAPAGNLQLRGNEKMVAEYPKQNSSGIFYRPMLNHRLVVLYNPDPGRTTSSWRVAKTVSVNLPNAAPIFSVGVERAVFAERTTKLTFDDGVLMDVSVQKESELNEFFSIPIRVAELAVSYPAQLLKIRINRTSNTEALLQNQQNHLLALEKLKETKDEGDSLEEKKKAGLFKFSAEDAKVACEDGRTTLPSAPNITESLITECVEYIRDPNNCPANDLQ